VLSRSFIDVVGDGDGGRDFAEVGHDAAVQPFNALRAHRVPEQPDHLGLLLGQTQIESGCKYNITFCKS